MQTYEAAKGAYTKGDFTTSSPSAAEVLKAKDLIRHFKVDGCMNRYSLTFDGFR